MNYYLDFDNTLYETARLTTAMLAAITESVAEETGLKPELIGDYVSKNFASTTDNIFKYAEKIAIKYGIDATEIKDAVKDVIDNGEGFVFEDAKRFLERLKENGHKLFVLTYTAKGNQAYQLRKILGSGLYEHFDGIITTTELKYTIGIDYRNGIFIDDDPRDLNGLFSRGAKKVIRIKKPSNRRSKLKLENPQIEEYESFDNIKVPKSREKEEGR